MGHIVEDRTLRPLLQEHLKQRDRIIYLDETEVIEHNSGQASSGLILKGQETTATAQLVIAVDGRKSAWPPPQASPIAVGTMRKPLVCAEHEKPHRGVAYQHFCLRARSPFCHSKITAPQLSGQRRKTTQKP